VSDSEITEAIYNQLLRNNSNSISLEDTIIIVLDEFSTHGKPTISSEGVIWVVLFHELFIMEEFSTIAKQHNVINELVNAIRENGSKIREIEMKEVSRFYDSYQWTKDVMNTFFVNVFPNESDIGRNNLVKRVETKFINSLMTLKWSGFLYPSYTEGLITGLLLSFSPFAIYEISDGARQKIKQMREEWELFPILNLHLYHQIILGLNIILTEFRQIVADNW